MKKIIMILATLIIGSDSIAQKAGENATIPALSPKEVMKMEVMKTNPGVSPVRIGSPTTSQNLSPKELMKVQVPRSYPGKANAVSGCNISTCAACRSLYSLSPKERMKAEIAGIYKCAMPLDSVCMSNNKCR